MCLSHHSPLPSHAWRPCLKRGRTSRLGSCVASVRWQVTKTHPLDQFRCDPFGIDHGFIRGDIEMQVLFVDTPEGTQVGPECCACPLTGIAMDLALTISMVIPRPFAHPVGNRGMARMAPPITLPFISTEQRAPRRHIVSNQVMAGLPVCMVADPPALLSRVARDDTDDGGTIIRIGAMSFALVGASPGWIRRVRVRRAFFPPRCGTARRLRRPCPSSRQSGRSHSDEPEYAAVAYGAVCVTVPTRVPGAPWARPWRYHAAGGPAWLGVGGSFQRQCWSGAYSSRHTGANGMPGNRPAAGRVGAHGYDSGGMRTHLDAGDALAK
jgi:hypothetical protein